MKIILLYNFLPVYPNAADARIKVDRMAVEQNDIRVLSDPERANARTDSAVVCRINRYGMERGLLLHAGLYGERGTKREIFDRNGGVVGDDCDIKASLREDFIRFKAGMVQFDFAAFTQSRANHERIVLFLQEVTDEAALGHMLQRDVDIEFLWQSGLRS